jgi:hypothetical protein
MMCWLRRSGALHRDDDGPSAVLPNRMGRIDYRLSGRILTVNATSAIPLQ